MANPLQTDEEIDAAARDFAANLPAVQQQAPVDPVTMDMLRAKISSMEKAPSFAAPMSKLAPPKTALAALRSAQNEMNMSGGPNRSVQPTGELSSRVPENYPTPAKIAERKKDMDAADAAGIYMSEDGPTAKPTDMELRSMERGRINDDQREIDQNPRHTFSGMGVSGGDAGHSSMSMAAMGRTVHNPLLTDEQAQQYSDATEKQLAHLDEMASLDLDVARARGEANAELANAQANAIERRNAQVESLRAEKDAYVSNKLGELEASSQRIASSQIDPEQYFSGPLGGIGRVIAAAAVGMGQYSAAKSGGQNAAMAIINDSINRNVRAQEMNLNNQKDAFGIQSNLFRQNLAAFGDREQAIEATKVNYLDLAKTQVDKTFANIQKGPAADAGFNEMQAKIAEQRAKSIAVLADLMNAKTAEQQSYKLGYGGSGGLVDTRSKDKKKLDFEYDSAWQKSTYFPDFRASLPISMAQRPEGEALMKAVVFHSQNLHTLRAAADTAREIMNTGVTSPLELKKLVRDYNRKVYIAAQGLSKEFGQGTIRDAELKRQLGLAGDEISSLTPNAFLKTQIESLDTLIKHYSARMEASAESHGLVKTYPVWDHGPDGVPRLRYMPKGPITSPTHDATDKTEAAHKPGTVRAK